MEDLVYINSLYDYYGSLLTDKQRSYFEDYYFDNLTMDEIASNYEVSKNAVSKSIMETKDKLFYYEEILHLYSNKLKIESILGDDVSKISDYI